VAVAEEEDEEDEAAADGARGSLKYQCVSVPAVHTCTILRNTTRGRTRAHTGHTRSHTRRDALTRIESVGGRENTNARHAFSLTCTIISRRGHELEVS
jgi:hypothetical protein